MATRILLLVAVSSDVVDQFVAAAKLVAHVTPTWGSYIDLKK